MKIYISALIALIGMSIACFIYARYYNNKYEREREGRREAEQRIINMRRNVEIRDKQDGLRRQREETKHTRIKGKVSHAKENDFEDFYDADDKLPHPLESVTTNVEHYNYRTGEFTNDYSTDSSSSDSSDSDSGDGN